MRDLVPFVQFKSLKNTPGGVLLLKVTVLHGCFSHFKIVQIIPNCATHHIWDEVFKNGPSKSVEGCLPQILLGPFLNTLSHIYVVDKSCKKVLYQYSEKNFSLEAQPVKVLRYSSIRFYNGNTRTMEPLKN